MERWLIVASGAYGLLAVALGAFGAHGLRRFLDGLADGAQRAEWWSTAAHYHLVHALALGLCAWLAGRGAGAAAAVAGGCFAAGVLLFSGSLYTMTVTGARWLGAVTPIGGLLLIAGWASVIAAGLRLR
ncbi:MAG: DUF423 domain-containing protein [Myxococcales bacterium]|nr:DUF423 domain-containing protein [Myxococcales bacterium]